MVVAYGRTARVIMIKGQPSTGIAGGQPREVQMLPGRLSADIIAAKSVRRTPGVRSQDHERTA
jgi:hypothetical protein